MGFEWDKFEDAEKGFDWDAHEDVTPDSERTSMLESGARGAAQGASLGFADEITGAVEAALTDKTYEQARDESRANYKRAKEDNPITYGTGEFGGGVATALVPGLNAAKGLKGAVGLGAAMGTLAGAGYSEADNAQDVALDAGKGMAIGAGGGAAGYGLSKAVPWASKKAGEKLKWLAEKSAVNATGATGKQAAEFADDAGRQLLDRKIVRFGDSPSKIAERASKAVGVAEGNIDEALTALESGGAKVDANDIYNTLRDKINKLKSDPSNSEIVAGLEKEIDNLIGATDSAGSSTFGLKQAEQIKRGYGRKAGNWNDPEKSMVGKELYRTFKGGVEGVAEKADPAMAKLFNEGKETYGLLAPIQEAAERRAQASQQSQIGGLLDLGSIGTGMATGNPVTGAVAPLARRALAPRVASSVAAGSDAVSKFLLKSPKMQALAKSNPPAFMSIAQSISGRVSSGASKAASADKPVDFEQAKDDFVKGN